MGIAAIAWAQAGGSSEGSAGLLSLAPFVLIFAVFYFLLILPQQKKQKRQKEMLSKLKKGDRIILSSGIWGSITRLDKDTVTVQIDDNTKIKVQREYVAQLRTNDEG